MQRFVVRVWLPDRPGALGQVASRIGAVRGDVVGIDILERGAGRAIDELVVELPDGDLVDLLVQEIRAVDGVAVEDIRPVTDALRDARLDALETAAMLVSAQDAGELLDLLAQHAIVDFEAEWAAVLEPTEAEIAASVGPVPPGPWLAAFIAGSRSSELVAAGETGPDDVAWAPLASAHLNLVIGRRGRPLRARERRQVAALARIADTRWIEVRDRPSRGRHPSVAS
jgi:hypothetical protein